MKYNVVDRIFRKKTIDKINTKINFLGDTKWNAYNFLLLRLSFIVIIFFLIFFFSKFGYILAPLSAFIFNYLFEYIFLDIPILKRQKRLEKEALFFFEVLALTLEGGRTLRHALELTVHNIDSELSLEFKKMLEEVRLGKSLNEAIMAMKKRIPSDIINSTLLNMIESNTFGISVTKSMYNQIDYLRDKQILDVKAEIAKLPTKVSVISVIFFVPIMLLIILAPVILELLAK